MHGQRLDPESAQGLVDDPTDPIEIVAGALRENRIEVVIVDAGAEARETVLAMCR